MPQQEQHRKPGSPADRLALGAGAGLLVPSTIGGHQVVQSARRKTGAKAHPFQSTDILRLGGKTRAKHAAGWAASRGVGGVGLGLASAGLYGATQRSSHKKVTDLSPKQGVKSLRQSAKNPRTGNRKRDIAVMGGSGLIGQAAASELINSRVGRVAPTKMPHWGRALGSAAGATAGLTAGRAAMHRFQRWDREKAMSKRAGETAGQERSRLHRNALQVQAAGQVPFVGDPIAAGRAAQLAPKGEKKRAFGTVLGSQWGANLGGTAAGSLAGYHAGKRFKSVQRGSEKIERGMTRAQNKVREKLNIPKREPYAGRGAEALKHVARAGKALKLNTPAGMAGSMVGGTLAVNTIPPMAYRRYQRKHEATHPENVRKAAHRDMSDSDLKSRFRQIERRYVQHHKHGTDEDPKALHAEARAIWREQKRRGTGYTLHKTKYAHLFKPGTRKDYQSVGKANERPLSNAEVESLHRGKRRQAKMSLTLAAMGAGASGMLLGGKGIQAAHYARLKRAGKYVKPPRKPGSELTGAATNLSIASGGLGAASSLQFARNQKLEARQKVQKDDWQDKRYRRLADKSYESSTGMSRVHRGTYPPSSWMKENAVGVDREGKVYRGRKQLKQPVSRRHAERAGEHSDKSAEQRRQYRKNQALFFMPGARERRDAATRREGRARRHGQDALIRSTGIEKALLRMPRVPRAVPVGAGRNKAPVSSFVMRRRNPMTGATRAFTVRGGMR